VHQKFSKRYFLRDDGATLKFSLIYLIDFIDKKHGITVAHYKSINP
jgi:hypothetical protein